MEVQDRCFTKLSACCPFSEVFRLPPLTDLSSRFPQRWITRSAMRANATTALVAEDVVLVPYRQVHPWFYPKHWVAVLICFFGRKEHVEVRNIVLFVLETPCDSRLPDRNTMSGWRIQNFKHLPRVSHWRWKKSTKCNVSSSGTLSLVLPFLDLGIFTTGKWQEDEDSKIYHFSFRVWISECEDRVDIHHISKTSRLEFFQWITNDWWCQPLPKGNSRGWWFRGRGWNYDRRYGINILNNQSYTELQKNRIEERVLPPRLFKPCSRTLCLQTPLRNCLYSQITL